MTKADAKKIAKLHMYSFFFLSDGFCAENLSDKDNEKINEEMKELCEKELVKLGVGSHGTTENCVEAILNKVIKENSND